MNAKVLGMICISLAIIFLLGSFLSPYVAMAGTSIPLAGVSIIFVILSILFFQQAEKSDMRRQWKLNSEIAKEMRKAASAIDAEEKNEKKTSGELKKEISSLAADMKRQDRTLGAGLKKQGKTLSVEVKRQAKAGKELKKRVDFLASDVKKMKAPQAAEKEVHDKKAHKSA